MAVVYVCDGCKKQEPGEFVITNPIHWFKPQHWYQRADKNGIQDACSRECAEKISKKNGNTPLFAPF